MKYRMTAAETAEAAQLYADGVTIRELADRYGCGHQQVTARLRAAGVEVRPRGPRSSLTLAQVAEAQVLYAAGVTVAALAAGYGCRRETLSAAMVRAGSVIRRGAPRRRRTTTEGVSDG